MKELIRHILHKEFLIEMPAKSTKEEFIRKAKEIHGDKFNYDKVNYVNGTTKVIITCPIHGDFLQTPSNHLKGGCKKCADSNRDYLRVSLDQFIDRANKKHKNKYDYSKVSYVNTTDKVIIGCPIHGDFEQEGNSHLLGVGCPKCAGVKKLTPIEFIQKAKEVHGDKFDYSNSNYKNSATKVEIICPIHGSFYQTPNSHLQGIGCKKCGHDSVSNKLSRKQDEFIKLVEKKHNGKYSYEKTKYVDAHTPIIITCPIHGDFKSTPNKHFRGGGCAKCAGKYLDQDYFIELAKEIHGDKYDYSKVFYQGGKTPVEIICPQHGSFMQAPGNHINSKQGCPICGTEKAHEKTRLSRDEFIKRAVEVHGNKFNYDNLHYTSLKNNVTITCPKHGDFSQNAGNHLLGFGCPKCSQSRGEKIVGDILTKNGINYERQKRFTQCFNIGPTGKCTRLPMDFYLPDYNCVIEYDGIQHYEPIESFGGKKALEMTKIRDEIKNTYCRENDIKMIRISYKLPFQEIAPFILSELGINKV
jgi:hypothetical protein